MAPRNLGYLCESCLRCRRLQQAKAVADPAQQLSLPADRSYASGVAIVTLRLGAQLDTARTAFVTFQTPPQAGSA
jgi:hypothetical protein